MKARVLAPLALLLVLAAAGCGGGGTETVTVTKTVTVTRTDTTPLPGTRTVRVYFLRGGKVAAAGREIARTRAVAAAALALLFDGPNGDEEALELTTALPDGAPPSVTIEDGSARVSGTPDELSREALAQVVYTLTQFPTVQSVEVDEASYTRAELEDVTPAILVESPLPFEPVTAPLRITGTANTFEATFEYELTDPDGKIVKRGFTTATSGSGTRGTFDFRIPFEVAQVGLGELIVFERSAADGSRTNIVEIPVRFGS